MNRRDLRFLVEQSTALREHIDLRFDSIDRRFDAVDRRFDTIERRLDAVIEALAAHVADRDMHHDDPS